MRAVRSGRWKLQLEHVDHQAPDPEAIGNCGKRGAVTNVSRRQALFDLQDDPGETRDLSHKYANRVKDLLKLTPAGKAMAGARRRGS